jgi:hypothetical protein
MEIGMKLRHIKSENRRYIDILVLLIVNTLISTYFIVNRVAQVSETAPGVVINLVADDGGEADEEQGGKTDNGNSWQGVQIIDGKQVWSTNTSVDIFKIEYKNGENVVTADGETDDIIAPGTSNVYNFTVSNAGLAPIDYQMAVEAYFSNKNYTIPVTVRLLDKSGRYFAGSEEKWVSLTELNKVTDYEVLKAGSSNGYILEWKLPYDEDGEYDAVFSRLAEADDVTLTVVVHTKAMVDAELYAAQNSDSQEKAGNKEGSSHWLRIFGKSVRAGDAVKLLVWCALAVVVIITGFRIFIKGKIKGNR